MTGLNNGTIAENYSYSYYGEPSKILSLESIGE